MVKFCIFEVAKDMVTTDVLYGATVATAVEMTAS